MSVTRAPNLLDNLGYDLSHNVCIASEQIDISGVWTCDDGALYYIRQIGPDILWYGEAAAGTHFFANVAHGRLDDGYLRLTWADVPRRGHADAGPGRVPSLPHACGGLVLQCGQPGRMAAVRQTGGFGGSIWTR